MPSDIDLPKSPEPDHAGRSGALAPSTQGKVLVVDDNESALRATVRILQMAGFEVTAAVDGANALRQIRALPPDLVLLDVMLPDISGLEVLRQVRADPVLADVYCVMLSFRQTTPQQQASALDAGADGYLVGPIASQELVARVHSHLRQRELTRQLRWQTAFMEAQVNSSLDAIIVVDKQGKKILQNQRTAQLFNIPAEIADDKDDEKQVRWVMSMVRNSDTFVEKIIFLYSHPNEISRDEIELKDGTILDRYSSPVVGKNGIYYGRIWTFRDITGERRVELELKEAKVAAVMRDSAKRYNFLADTVPLIIWTARPDGCLDYYNKTWFDYAGVTLAQTQDWGWGAVVHPDDLQRCIERWTRSFTTGEDYEIEYRFKRAADGAYRWFLGRASARRNEAGEIEQWVGTCTDIEDQKRAEAELRQARSTLESQVAERTAELEKTNQALQRQHAELRALFDVVPALIWFKDTNNGILRVNQRVAETVGRPVEEIEGKSSQEIYPHESAGFYADDLEVIRSGRSKLAYVEKLRGPDGKDLWVQTDKVPYRDNDGKVIGIVVMAHDITVRKNSEDSLRLLNSAVEQANESVLITDAQLDLPGPRILFVNPAFTKMTGYSAEEAIGRTPRLLQGPRTDKAVLSRLRHDLERGEAFAGEAINYRKDGTEFDLEWQVAPIRDSRGIITHFVAIQHDITARAKTENALRESNEKFHQLADNISDAFWIRSPDMRHVHYASPAVEKIWGRPVEGLYANPRQWVDFILAEDQDRVVSAFAALTGDTPSLDIEYRIVRPGGEIRWVRVRGFQVRDAKNKLIRHTGIVTDITERKQFDAHKFTSQKLEMVGKLAGGIAHEFNSILTAIIGHSDLLLRDLDAGSPFARNVIEINEAAHRAATLTRQLLAYGRKQILQPVILDLNLIVTGMEGILRQIMGDEVSLHVVAAPGLHAVEADAGQIEQVIMNIAVNGREAMPNGGKLTFETADVHFDRDSMGRDSELKPGNYVMLAITDTGPGMSAEVKARLFEPFFTTKAVGQGTGLGLSTCHGIVKQSGGHISVYSEPGRGSTFKIYLPQVEQQAKLSIPRPDSQALPRGTETILLVEDDAALLKLAVILLRRLGYTVFPASNGVEALSLSRKATVGHIDLLFTDVVMPHMGGKELADRVRASYPHTRILFTSSYTENAIVHQGVLDKGVALLQKPFTPSALARKVREVLDE